MRITWIAFLGVLGAGLLLLLAQHCSREEGERAGRAAAPSRIIGQTTHADGTQTTTATVLQDDQRQALRTLEAANDSLSSELAWVRADKAALAKQLSEKKRVQAATVFTTRTARGDTIRQGVVSRLTRKNLLARDELVVDVEQLTPGNRTLSMQSFQVPAPPPRRFGLGVQVGVGLGPDLQPRPQIGVGVSYNLIRW